MLFSLKIFSFCTHFHTCRSYSKLHFYPSKYIFRMQLFSNEIFLFFYSFFFCRHFGCKQFKCSTSFRATTIATSMGMTSLQSSTSRLEVNNHFIKSWSEQRKHLVWNIINKNYTHTHINNIIFTSVRQANEQKTRMKKQTIFEVKLWKHRLQSHQQIWKIHRRLSTRKKRKNILERSKFSAPKYIRREYNHQYSRKNRANNLRYIC